MAEQIKIDIGCRVTPKGLELCSSELAWMEFEATVEVERFQNHWGIVGIKAESMHDDSFAYLDGEFFTDVIFFITQSDLWDFIQRSAEERRLAA